jgi:hypothetical protein
MTRQSPSHFPHAARWPHLAWRGVWKRCLGLVVAGLALCATLVPGAGEAPFSEYQVKSTWLLNFARFVEWPATAFPNAKAPFVVGILGRGPIGTDLEQVFAEKSVKGRAFEIRRLTPDSDVTGCHILFVTASEKRRFADTLAKIAGGPVLTVGETGEFLEQGGIVNFLLKDKTVRFEISLTAAQAAGLKLEVNLLKVAVAVQGKYD